MLEVSLFFFDGVQQKFPKSVDKLIEDLATNHFIEYVQEDLSQKTEEKISMISQGLLEAGETSGVRRVFEAL